MFQSFEGFKVENLETSRPCDFETCFSPNSTRPALRWQSRRLFQVNTFGGDKVQLYKVPVDKDRADKVRIDKDRGDDVQPIAGQVAVITGAGHGIGAAIARKLSNLGATAVLCGRTLAALESTGQAIAEAGGKAEVVPCDVTSLQFVEAAARRVEALFGRVDILVNNAGIGGFGGPLHELAPEAWEQILNTNLRGVYYVVRAFAPMMIRARSGHIINISSLAGKNALPNGAAYAASKWGLNGLSYSLAEELRGHNIRVAVVCPGSTNTELSPHVGKDPGKMLQPDDVAYAVGMLVTQSAQSFVSEILMRPTQKP
jgi:3-oxoacyl-[acyl-carrier protein] reductase